MDDREILKLLNERDEAAIAALGESYGALLRRIIRNILSDPRDAEECESAVLISVWESIPPAAPENLRAYCARIARNAALMRLRAENAGKRAGKTVPLDELDGILPAIASPESEAEAKELGKAISRFLSGLNEKKRGIFVRRYYCFDSIGAIAKAYSMREASVSLSLHRTKKALKLFLKEEGMIDE